jgi:hypothetical protein
MLGVADTNNESYEHPGLLFDNIDDQSINIDCSLRRNLSRLCGSLADVADLPELEKPQH